MIIVQATQVLSAVHFTFVVQHRRPDLLDQGLPQRYFAAHSTLVHDGRIMPEDLTWAFRSLSDDAACELAGAHALTFEDVL